MDVNASRKRRRPALACEECRRRKIKCDKKTPCNQCAKSKSVTVTCTYCPDPGLILKRPCRVDANPLTVDQRTSAGAVNSPSAAPSTDATREMPVLGGHFGERMNPHAGLAGPDTGSSLQALPAQVQKLEERLLDTVEANPTVDDTAQHPEGSFSKTRYFGPSHWMNNLETV